MSSILKLWPSLRFTMLDARTSSGRPIVYFKTDDGVEDIRPLHSKTEAREYLQNLRQLGSVSSRSVPGMRLAIECTNLPESPEKTTWAVMRLSDTRIALEVLST